MDEEEIIEAHAVTDSNIIYRITSFLGIPIFIIIGWLKNKYVSIFSVEHNDHRLVVLYYGICPVVKNDKLRITGLMESGEKVGICGMVMVGYKIENISTGDTYKNV